MFKYVLNIIFILFIVPSVVFGMESNDTDIQTIRTQQLLELKSSLSPKDKNNAYLTTGCIF